MTAQRPIRPLIAAASVLFGVAVFLLILVLLSPGASRAQGGCPPVANTPFFTFAYGAVTIDGGEAAVGTVIEARTPRGDVAGCTVVQDPGDFGAMYIYGEDNSVSPPVPGMCSGETVVFYVGGSEATAAPELTWSNDKDFHEVDLSAVGAPVEAGFVASPLTGTVPLTVSFTNQSSGSYSSSLWSFGDGTTSTDDSPDHTYTAPDVYTVSLSVTGGTGADTLVRMSYITACHAADVVCDCIVDVADVQAVAARWRCEDGDVCYDARYDLDDDMAVTVLDIMTVAAAWNWSCER